MKKDQSAPPPTYRRSQRSKVSPFNGPLVVVWDLNIFLLALIEREIHFVSIKVGTTFKP